MAAVGSCSFVHESGLVLVGLSGGGDSVCLLHALRAVFSSRGDGEVRRLRAICIDHGLREGSREASARAAEWARSLGVEAEVRPVRVRAGDGSLQEAARKARYAAFEEAARRAGARFVALAHTADDQAETVLMHILRGSGISGLSGMPEKRGMYRRPLLGVWRRQTHAYCDAMGLPYEEDPANADWRFLRSRVRHGLLPLLEKEYNPRLREALVRLAELARDDDRALEGLAEDAARVLLRPTPAGLALDGEALNASPPAVARRVVRQALRRLLGAPPPFEMVEAVRRLARDSVRHGVQVDLGSGCFGERVYGAVWIGRWQARRSSPWQAPLPVPGAVRTPVGGFEVSARPLAGQAGDRTAVRAEGGDWTSAETVLWVSKGARLWARSRLPGDRMRPEGLGGGKKVQDLMVDAKVPAPVRGFLPIIADEAGILWVSGLARDERAARAGEGREPVEVRVRWLDADW